MYALIHPVEVLCVASWQGGEPVMQPISNSARVCQVEAAPFDVAAPCTWVECPDGVTADVHYYNVDTQTFHLIEHAPRA